MIHEPTAERKSAGVERRPLPPSMAARKSSWPETSGASALRQRGGNQGLQRLLGEMSGNAKGVTPPRPQSIQAKLTINQPGDAHEQEADRVADAVMRMPDTAAVARETPSLAQAGSIASVQRLCAECDEELSKTPGAKPVQTKEQGSAAPPVTPQVAANIQGLRGGGSALPAATRAFFEPRFGYDFGGVRVHTGAQAEKAARSVNARAFTVGTDVVFGAGQYSPETNAGKRLLAHELTHVVQQQQSTAALQRQEIPRELQQTPNYAEMSDEELAARYDEIVDVLAQFTSSTPDTALLEYVAAEIGVVLAHRRALAAGRTFDEKSIGTMRNYFKKNAKTEKDSCIVCLNKGMQLVTGVPALATTPESIEKTMAKIAASGYSSEAREIWFQGKNGKITRGAARPEKLNESIWETVITLSGGDPGWSVFTMSLLDGYHSVTLTLDASNPTSPRIYWSDQWQSKKGWKEYSRSSLDAEVVKLVRQWWDDQAEGKKHTTVVRLWRMRATKAS